MSLSSFDNLSTSTQFDILIGGSIMIPLGQMNFKVNTMLSGSFSMDKKSFKILFLVSN
jgi:hypothetical protein